MRRAALLLPVIPPNLPSAVLLSLSAWDFLGNSCPAENADSAVSPTTLAVVNHSFFRQTSTPWFNVTYSGSSRTAIQLRSRLSRAWLSAGRGRPYSTRWLRSSAGMGKGVGGPTTASILSLPDAATG
jgi:hypothetical protein